MSDFTLEELVLKLDSIRDDINIILQGIDVIEEDANRHCPYKPGSTVTIEKIEGTYAAYEGKEFHVFSGRLAYFKDKYVWMLFVSLLKNNKEPSQRNVTLVCELDGTKVRVKKQ